MDIPVTYDSQDNLWRSVKTTRLFDPTCSMGRMALYMMHSKPSDAVCQISDSEGTSLTYGTATSYAIRIAQHFKQMGLSQDDVVGLVAPNTTLLMPVIAGCLMNCTPFHAANPVHEEHVIKHLFNITKPKVIFCDGLHYEKVKRATSELNAKIFTLCNHVVDVAKVEDLLEPTMSEHFYQAESLKYGPDQTMAVYCSSGTTGLPKGVCISNRSLSEDHSFINGSMVLFSFSSPDWTTGLFNTLYNIMNGGTRIITSKPYSPEYMLEIIVKYKVSFLGVAPTQMSMVSLLPGYNRQTMQSVRLIFQTGGHCSEATLDRIRAALTMGILMNAYGSTELGGIACNFGGAKPKAVGRLLPNTELKILDEESGAKVAHNQLGEIYVSNGRKWAGYYGNSESTAEIYDSQGWLRTGDIGYMDEDNYLFLMDRSKDIMKYEGMQYSPHEIEETITELADVVDVCVFGVFNESLGDLAAAAVVKKADSQLSQDDVLAYVASQQEVKHKRLNYGVFFVKEIARNSNGKVLRRKMKELCLGMEEDNGGNRKDAAAPMIEIECEMGSISEIKARLGFK